MEGGKNKNIKLRMADFLDCKICHIQYDEEDHRPRHASCGHDICSVCLKALIKESVYMCPNCKQKHIVDEPDDLTINFGLIDVLRAFQSENISLVKETDQEKSVTVNDEICKVHHKSIGHRCLKCLIWICEKCIGAHTTLVGCTTISSSNALSNMKQEHTKNIDKLLTYFEEDANFVSSMIKEHTDKRNQCLEMAENHDKEAEKFQILLQQGINQKKLLEKSKKQLIATCSPNAVMDKIEVLIQWKQAIRSWSVKNLGSDSLICLLKSLEEGKNVFAEITNEKETIQAKLSLHSESLYVHHFWKQTVADGCITMSFDRLKKMIPDDHSLVFLELSVGGVVKGKLILRLKENLPNIRKNFVEIISGQGQGRKSLSGIQFNNKNNYDINRQSMSFSDMPVTQDRNDCAIAKPGDIVGYFGSGYLQHLYFYVDNPPNTRNYGSNYCVFASVEEGLNLLRECHAKYSDGVIITDCGMVI